MGAACSPPVTTMTAVRRRRPAATPPQARRSTPRTAPAIPREEIEGDAIKLVSSYPQSGLTAAFAEISRGWEAYLEKVNEDGGVDLGDWTFTFEVVDKTTSTTRRRRRRTSTR